MKIYKLIIIVSIFWMVMSCASDRLIGPPKPEGGGSAPDQIGNVIVENLPGGAKISYSLPANENLLYVKAVYNIRPGKVKEVKSSYFKNFMVIDGFADVKEQEIKLYSVSRTEQVSAPITVKITPLTPAVLETFKSLVLNATFGGVSVGYKNGSQADLAYIVLTEDKAGKYTQVQTHYSKMKEGVFSVRGFDVNKRKFAVYVKDRWDNYSDTTYAELVPLFERELDKTKFKELPLATDNWQANPNVPTWNMSRLWDGVRDSNGGSFNSTLGMGFPQSFSFSLGVSATLSRFIYYPMMNRGCAYTVANPRLFEVWGSNDPTTDGSWDNWTKIMDCEMKKPSGLPAGECSSDDTAFAQAGVEFEFPPGTAPYKHLRFKVLEVWSGAHVWFDELSFYGN